MTEGNSTLSAVAAGLASIVCAEGDPERFFENMKFFREKVLSDGDKAKEKMVQFEELVTQFNRVLKSDPKMQEY